MEAKEFYIITPISNLDILNKVNLLVKGMLNVPIEVFYQQETDNLRHMYAMRIIVIRALTEAALAMNRSNENT